jgi:hypothetical protein
MLGNFFFTEFCNILGKNSFFSLMINMVTKYVKISHLSSLFGFLEVDVLFKLPTGIGKKVLVQIAFF